MCIHGKEDIERAIKNWANSDTYGVVYLQDKDGVPVQAMDCVEFSSTREVSRAIGCLKEWHPDTLKEGGSVSLSDINKKRVGQGMAALTVADVPAWEGIVPPSEDDTMTAPAVRPQGDRFEAEVSDA